MASSSAARKEKQRQKMRDKGLIRKDFWFTKENIELIEWYKRDKNLKSNDDAINQLLKNLILE